MSRLKNIIDTSSQILRSCIEIVCVCSQRDLDSQEKSTKIGKQLESFSVGLLLHPSLARYSAATASVKST